MITQQQRLIAQHEERQRRAEIMRALRLAKITVNEADIEIRLAINERAARERERSAWNGELG